MDSSSRKRKSTHSDKSKSECSFLIDGQRPIPTDPRLVSHKPEPNRQGRHRSVELKGLILSLIDNIYPPLVCPECFHTSNGRADADQHIKDAHHGTKLFSCVSKECEQAYSSKAGLRYHLEHNHTVTSIAGKSSTNQKLDRNHKTISVLKANENNSSKHELPKAIQAKLDDKYPVNLCPACNVEYKRKTHVVKHLADDHHGEEPYKCIVDECKRTKTYSTREGLIYHLINYHQ